MSISNCGSLLVLLDQSHLLTSEQMVAVRTEFGGEKSPQDVARTLTDRGLLTGWQAKMLLAGRKAFFLGKYKLLDQIGQGGMGSVFKAEQTGLGRVVALKVMGAQLLKDKGAVARFHREIQAAAALAHPNIVAAYDADCFKDTHFLVMEYVAGKTLDDVAKKQKQLPVAVACEYVRQAALGLQHAHERGMVHRDIKPANLLLAPGPDGETVVKILDMGLARFSSELSEEGALTQTGQIMGTPDYIAPEQARNTKLADIRSDVFSLGCTLFRLLTGAVPFGGVNVMEKLMARTLADAPRVRSVRPEVPAELDAIVAKMLARAPEGRYQTPAEVTNALSPFAGRSAMAAAGGTVAGMSSWQGGGGEAFAGSAGEGTRIDAGLDRFLQQLTTEAEAVAATRAEDDTARSGEIATMASRPKGTGSDSTRRDRRKQSAWRGLLLGGVAVIVLAGLLLAAALWVQSGQSVLVVEWPEDERSGGTLTVDGNPVALPVRGEMRFPGGTKRTAVASRKGYKPIRREWTLAAGEEAVFHLPWEPTGETARREEFAELESNVRELLKRSEGQLPLLNDHNVEGLWNQLVSAQRTAAMTKEGPALADLLRRMPAPADYLWREEIDSYELQIAGGGEAKKAPKEIVGLMGDTRFYHPGEHHGIAVSPDGKLIASAYRTPDVRLWDTQTGKLVRTLTGHGHATWSVNFSPDGSRIAACCYYTGAAVYETATGKHVCTLEPPPDDTFKYSDWVDFSHDGRHVVILHDLARARVCDAATGRQIAILAVPQGRVFPIQFQPDSQTLVCAHMEENGDPGGHSIAFWDYRTGKIKDHFDCGAPAHMVAISPDGRFLTFMKDQGVEIWNLPERRFARRIDDVPNATWMKFSADGTRAAITNGRVHMWNTSDWSPVESAAKIPFEDVGTAAFLPNSDILALATLSGRIHLWDLKQGTEMATGAPLTAFTQSPTGRGVFLGTAKGRFFLRDLASRREIEKFDAIPGPVQTLAASNDGRYLAAATGNPFHPGGPTPVVLRDLKNNRPAYAVNTQGYTLSAAFHPNSQILATGDFGGILKFWDAESGREQFSIKTWTGDTRYEVFSIAWSPDGTKLASGSWIFDKVLRIWDVKAKRELFNLVGHNAHVRSVAFSPDGSRLVSASDDGTVRLWNVKTGKSAGTLLFSSVGIPSVAFSPDGTRVAAGAWDGTVSLIRVPGGEVLREVSIPAANGILRIEFTPDGRHLMTQNGNGTVYVLRFDDWSSSPVDGTGKK